jgi:hypothetical protein
MAIIHINVIVQRIRNSLRFGNDLLALFFVNATKVVEIEIRLIRLRKITMKVLLIVYSSAISIDLSRSLGIILLES